MTQFSHFRWAMRPFIHYFPVLFLAIWPAAMQAQCPGTATGYNNPVVAVNNAATGTDPWNNPVNALTDNNSYATLTNAALLIGGTVRTSNFLVLRNLHFDIPVNAQICGVQVEIRKASSDNSGSNWTRDTDIRLLKDNLVTGTNHASTAANWPTTETAFTYGSNSDLWGTTLTGFDVSNNGFGVAISVQSRAAGLLLPTVISYIDAVRIRVYYTVPTSDIDGDGIADYSDSDMDGDGLSNSRELSTCSSPSSLTLATSAEPSLTNNTAAGVAMNISGFATAGAGVSTFHIDEGYAALAGPELRMEQDVNAAADHSIALLKFNSPVHNLRLRLQDVDLGAGQFQDNVRVNAYSAGQLYTLTAANYTLGSGNFNAFIGSNTFLGLVAMNDSEMNGTISIHIPDMIDSVKIIFSNADLANLGNQAVGIGQMTWCNPWSTSQDADGDGQPNFHDIDADNDGITDARELQSSIGFIPPTGLDSDNDGIDNAYDNSTGGINLAPTDTDSDGTADYHDSDSDNDGNSDRVEGNDANHNCTADFVLSNTDTDGDGLDNAYDTNNGGTTAPVQDTDGNGIPDYRQNTQPTIAAAGPDQVGNSVSFTLAANSPVSGLGYWTVTAGSGTFSNINNPLATVTGLSFGMNTYTWSVYTDGCHVSSDAVNVFQTSALPVTMGPLNVTADGSRALLKWTTYTEQNNRGFAVLHSTDGNNWQQIEFMPSFAAGGNSSSELYYAAVHPQPAKGRNYYRLAQEDVNGVVKYSNIQTLSFTLNTELHIHPNPVTTSIQLANADAQNIRQMKLMDAAGKIVFHSNKAGITSIDMSNRASGLYFLQVTYKDGSEKSCKVLKQ